MADLKFGGPWAWENLSLCQSFGDADLFVGGAVVEEIAIAAACGVLDCWVGHEFRNRRDFSAPGRQKRRPYGRNDRTAGTIEGERPSVLQERTSDFAVASATPMYLSAAP